MVSQTEILAEHFIPIKNYEGYYLIGEDGTVFSLFTNKFLKPFLSDSGYLQVTLHKKGTRKTHYIHLLVGHHFLSNPNGLPVLNHEDGNKLNNWFWNLSWCTQAHNIQHSINFGLTKQKGEDNPIAKLKRFEVIEIRSLYKSGSYSQNELAKKYNISRSVIKDIISGRTWKSI